jgi:hypothetical protein
MEFLENTVANTVFGRLTERFIRFGTRLKHILRPKVQSSIPRACLKFDTSQVPLR